MNHTVRRWAYYVSYNLILLANQWNILTKMWTYVAAPSRVYQTRISDVNL